MGVTENSHNGSIRWGLLHHQFIDGETEAWSCSVTCSRVVQQGGAGPDLNPVAQVLHKHRACLRGNAPLGSVSEVNY